jgi:hypothetical protein
VLENRVPRIIFGSKREEVAGGWRRLHNELLLNLSTSSNIIRMIRSRRMRRVGHVAHMVLISPKSFLFPPHIKNPYLLYLLTYLLTSFLPYLLTPWCRTLFEKLIVTQLVKKYPAFFMKPEASLVYSQNPTIRPYPEADESSTPHRSLPP